MVDFTVIHHNNTDYDTGASSPPSPGEITDLQVPDSIPVDLKAKLIVCLIHTKVKAPLEVNCFLPGFLIVTLRD